MLNESDSILFEMLSDSSSRTFFFFSNLQENCSRWSKGAVEYFGLESEMLYPALELWTEKIYPDDVETYLSEFDEMVHRHGTYHDCEYRIKNAQGDYVWVNCKGMVRYDEKDQPYLFAGFVTNMGSRNKFDPVTNLMAAYEFRNDLDARLQRGENGAALILSVSQFKRVNDLYSFSFGDKVLREIANRFQTCAPKDAEIYRMEGTDFGMLVPNATRQDVDALYKLMQKETETIVLEGDEVPIQFQAGCVFYPEHGDFVDPLQTHLFYALSRAKQLKTNEMIYYSAEIHKEQNERAKLRDALRKSVQNDFDSFRVVYQPIMDKSGERLVAAEALLRWKCDAFPQIGPVAFVPVLEETGLIKDVGKWVLSQCIKRMDTWKKEHNMSVKIHVNMSLIQLMDNDLASFLQKELGKYNVSPEQLVLELTESCRVEYSEELGKELQQFRDLGMEIALDDFGTGYASLSVLKDIPADIVKLDHTLIRSMMNRPKDRKLIEFIIMFCKNMDISVCAEGVENEEILSLVTDAGANMLQGYHFDRPLEEKEFFAKYICKSC